MEARHEIISFDNKSPIKLFTHKLGDVTRHWHESLELLFVLAGDVTVLTGDTQFTLSQDDMLLINSNVVHELHSESCVLIAVQIKLSRFDLPQNLVDFLYFDCNSKTTPSPERFLPLKHIITSMLQINMAGSETALFRNRSLAYALLSELVQNFRAEKPTSEHNTQKHLDRLNNILRYIGEHYQEQLTLSHLAEREHLSAPYLSSFFEKYMGINFSTYYTNLRLEHAVRDLLYTDIPVEQIAAANGFSDPRAFVRAFKKKFNSLPSAYRKTASVPTSIVQGEPLLAINYLDFKPENYFHILSQYLPEPPVSPRPLPAEVPALDVGSVDSRKEKAHLRHLWREIACVGRAKDLMYAEVQDMLRQLQQSVGFRYLRFHGLLSDDMLVCRREADHTLRFNFTLVDKVLDFILSLGLKPMVQLSFMPAALAADPNHTIFATPFIISPPARMEEWTYLVLCFLRHIRERYGTREIRSWLFSVWNEPDTSQDMFGFASSEEFFALYQATWNTVKSFDRELTFGSPSFLPLSDDGFVWISHYADFCREHSCMPEFLDVHYYSDNFQNLPPDGFYLRARTNGDPDHYRKYLDRVFAAAQQVGLGSLPTHITEWNFTVSHRNLINDTAFKGCYLVKNFLENYDRTASLSYWALTDLMEEQFPVPELFHGGMGLFTRNGIPKPVFYAMTMLARLEDTLVDSGEGWFITRSDSGKFSILLYNYEHCNPLSVDEGLGLTPTQRDGIFPVHGPLSVSLTLTGLSAHTYRVKETVLNQEHGSAFDLWVSAGGLAPTPEEEDWLRRAAVPALHISTRATENGQLPFSALLAPQEVRLVELTAAE